jgi:glutamine---fructose-6-phosphate transaminase (isomerizing)
MGLTDEIREQPAVVERLLGRLPGLLRPVADDVRRRGIEHVLIAARGSSDHAGVYGVYAIGAVGRLPVALAAPSLFSRYERPPRVARTLVLGISQSGRSPDVVSVVEGARAQGAVTLAITNEPASPLAAAAAHVVDLEAGPEQAVAATKTYTAQLTAVAALAAALGDATAEEWRALRALPEALHRALGDEEHIGAIASETADLAECVVLGRGYHLATALEWALKLKELAGVHAQAYSTADYEHGPVASFDPGSRLLAVRARGPMASDVDRLVTRLADERDAQAVVVADERPGRGAWLPFPADVPEWLSPIAAILPAQLFAAAVTVAKGMDPERPRGLSKVTLTR